MFNPKVLVKYRKEKKLSVSRLAAELTVRGFNVTRQAIENWEHKRNKPSIEGLVSLASFFDKPMTAFFDQKHKKDGYVLRG